MFQLNDKERLARSKLCLPMDGLNTKEEYVARAKELSPVVGLFKVGFESYTRFGPWAVEVIQDAGSAVFLDLKFKDIPNTVKGASKVAAEMGVYMFNVHATGTIEMMKAAVEGANLGATSNYMPRIVGVTMLTSINEETMNNELNIPGSLQEHVLRLAKNAQTAGLDGIVCSAVELDYIKNKLNPNFMYVTPGIQGISTSAGADQKRVFSPGNAILAGSSILVVGRAITSPATPEERLRAGYEILQDMAKYL